jgi:hypothetical protein
MTLDQELLELFYELKADKKIESTAAALLVLAQVLKERPVPAISPGRPPRPSPQKMLEMLKNMTGAAPQDGASPVDFVFPLP